MIKLQLAAVLFIFAMISTDSLAMKRNYDQLVHEQIEEKNLTSLPGEILWRILSSSPKSDLILVCKKFCTMFEFKNWLTIVQQQPAMITRYPLDCQRIYYYLMQQNNLAEIQKFFAEDTNHKRNLYSLHELLGKLRIDKDFKKEFDKLSDPNKIIEFYRQHHMPYFSDNKTMSPKQTFVNNILHNNLDEMREFIQNTSDETLAKVLRNKKETLAKLGSLAMFEVLAPKLPLEISYPNGDGGAVGPALDIILTDVIAEPNRSGRYDIIEFLLKLGADSNIDEGDSPIVAAITKAHTKNDYTLLKLLCAHGLDINPEENGDRLIGDGHSAIVWAIQNNNSRLVHILLSMGANPHTGIENENSSIDLLKLAQKNGNLEIIDAIEFTRIQWAQKDSAHTDDCQS